jgi:hypothetical protein
MRDLIGRIAALAEAQLDAARRIDVARISALAEERADALFELRCLVAESHELDPQERAALRADVNALRAVDARLAGVARLVLDGLQPWSPHGPAQTYGPAGQLG